MELTNEEKQILMYDFSHTIPTFSINNVFIIRVFPPDTYTVFMLVNTDSSIKRLLFSVIFILVSLFDLIMDFFIFTTEFDT